jgi:hypothetical protein
VYKGMVLGGGGVDRGVETMAEGGGEWLRLGEGGGERMVSRCFTIARMFPGNEARVMIVVTPTDAANSAAINFVTIPPVPTLLPGEDTIISLPLLE